MGVFYPLIFIYREHNLSFFSEAGHIASGSHFVSLRENSLRERRYNKGRSKRIQEMEPEI